MNYWAFYHLLIKLLLSIDSEIDQMYKIYCILGMPDSTCFTIGANNSRLLDFVGHEVVSVRMRSHNYSVVKYYCFIIFSFF